MMQSLLMKLTMAVVSLPTVSLANTQDAPTRSDPEIVRLAAEHESEAVRTAVDQCLAGNYEAAFPVLTKYSEGGDKGATYVLAKLYLDGLGIAKSPDKAISLFQSNIDRDHAPSLTALATMKESNATAEALQLYKQAAALDDARALAMLGSIYESGRLGMRANPKLAYKYYEKLQQAGNPLGYFHLGRCFDAGIGVSPDALKSTQMFLKAALAGVTQAQVVMARRYYDGQGLEMDPVAALGWLTLAAQSGSSEAMVLLGQRYEAGDVFAQDLNTAGKLYSGAAKQGDLTGRYYLALMYLNGKGTRPDPVRAYVLLEAAQALPKAKVAFDQLSQQLTPEQIADARKKIADGKGK